MEIGLVQLYTGDGKGKTTAAFGQAIRASGRGKKVIIIQFLKGEDSGEIIFLNQFDTGIEFHRFNSQRKFYWSMNDSEKEKLKKESVEGFVFAQKIIQNKSCDLLILDEITWVINYGFINFDDLSNTLKNRPEGMEIVLTGRDADKNYFDIADLITEMKKIKHPFDKGVPARKGIDE